MKKFDLIDKISLGTFVVFLAILSIGALFPGTYLDRLVSYRNGVRRFLGLRDGMFLLLIIPLIMLIKVAHKSLILYKPLEKFEKIVVGLLFLGLIFAFASSHASPHTNVVFTQPIANHVIVITFDGTRADVFRKASPTADYFKTLGARCEYAVSTYPTITYPSHTTMFTGTYAIVHGVRDNAYYKVKAQTIFEVAHDLGLKSALVTPASTLANMLSKSGTVADVYTGEKYADIGTVTQTAESIVKDYNIIRLHYVESDDAGHTFGADSPQYKSVIAAEQNEVKELIEYLMNEGLRNDTVIILTADHGMFVNKHHHIYPSLVDHVPFLIMGGKVRPMELDRASTIDIAPTIALILGIPVPSEAVGVAVGEPFGMSNVRCDTGSLRLNEFISAIAVSLLLTANVVSIFHRLSKKFLLRNRKGLGKNRN